MKIIIPSLFMLISILFMSKKEAGIGIEGTWKMNLYTMDSDTLYVENSEKYTLSYFEKTMKNLADTEEKRNKIKAEGQKLYNLFKTVELQINKNTIQSYRSDGMLTEINLKYKLIDGKIIPDEKGNQKHQYTIDFDEGTDQLTIRQGGPDMKIVNRYSRVKK